MRNSALIVLLSLVMCATAAAQLPENPHISVAVFNDAGAPPRVIGEAQIIAGKIYRDIGITIIWKDHASVAAADGSQFFVRIVPRSLTLPGEDFGIAFVGADGRGIQADVFYSGIERFARNSSINPAEIMGHVIAHELGHLLLGMNSHSSLGVMQAHWREPQLRQMRMGVLRFEKRQAEAISARLLDSQAVPQTVAGLTGY